MCTNIEIILGNSMMTEQIDTICHLQIYGEGIKIEMERLID
jgi:hypothetical protein